MTAYEKPAGPRHRLYDMHCHLDFAANGAALARKASHTGIRAFSTTVDPRDYRDALGLLDGVSGMYVGLGLHPWWLADGRCGEEEVRLFVELAAQVRLIGEVGLDFAPRREGSFDRQRAVFARLMGACAGGGRLFSFHSVRAASVLLDVLEETRALDGSAAVLHWFSDSGEKLNRAVRLGCLFSVGSRMLATKRGRSYARSLPAERLLLETDLPDEPGDRLELGTWQADLEKTLARLAELRGLAVDAMAEQLVQNSEEALAAATR